MSIRIENLENDLKKASHASLKSHGVLLVHNVGHVIASAFKVSSAYVATMLGGGFCSMAAVEIVQFVCTYEEFERSFNIAFLT
jgi:hypothetical protein